MTEKYEDTGYETPSYFARHGSGFPGEEESKPDMLQLGWPIVEWVMLISRKAGFMGSYVVIDHNLEFNEKHFVGNPGNWMDA